MMERYETVILFTFLLLFQYNFAFFCFFFLARGSSASCPLNCHVTHIDINISSASSSSSWTQLFSSWGRLDSTRTVEAGMAGGTVDNLISVDMAAGSSLEEGTLDKLAACPLTVCICSIEYRSGHS